jgi:putative spermidine/putrescine transport system substrate-binding protein
VPAESVLPLANRATIAEIDYTVVDAADLYEPLVLSHGVGVSLYATLLAYFEEMLDPSLSPPGSWSDFWATGRYPGFRGFQEAPIGTLEFALLAGGASMSNLYPLDVDAAFAQLDLIAEDILLWWRQGAQPTQMIAAGEITMVATWHDRMIALAEGGAPVGYTWEQSQVNGNCWVVPNGAPEAELAMDFINFATRPEVSAAFSRLFPFGPINRRAYDLLEEGARDSMPGAPGIAGKQFVIDLEWWFQNGDAVRERFREWLAQEPEDEKDDEGS